LTNAARDAGVADIQTEEARDTAFDHTVVLQKTADLFGTLYQEPRREIP
jgi:hypothetical protein